MKWQLIGTVAVFGWLAVGPAPRATAQYGPPGRPPGFGTGTPGQNAPGYSPYLNLLRPGAPFYQNYYGLVRPELEFRRGIQSNQQGIQANAQALDQALVGSDLPVTGNVARFMDYGRYFQNRNGVAQGFGRGSAPGLGAGIGARPGGFGATAGARGGAGAGAAGSYRR